VRPAIAPAATEDLPAIVDLLERSGLPRAGIGDHLATTLVARAGGRVVGCAAVELYGPAALLRSVAVRARRRGQGVGGKLTRAALDLARGSDVTVVYLLTETAAGFFPRFGFRPIPRTEVTPAVRRSVEFTSACPASAQAMVAELS
jgi:amino-acid N-acetyltransferase